MVKRPTLKDFKREAMKDEGFREAYEELRPEFEFMMQLVKARKGKGMTQEDVAKKMRVKQPSVGRLETGKISPSIGRVVQYADAVGKKVVLQSKRSVRKAKKKLV